MAVIADLSRIARTLDALAIMSARPLRTSEIKSFTRSAHDIAKYVLAEDAAFSGIHKAIAGVGEITTFIKIGRRFDASATTSVLTDAAAQVRTIANRLGEPRRLAAAESNVDPAMVELLEKEILEATALQTDNYVRADGSRLQGILRNTIQFIGTELIGVHVHGGDNVAKTGRAILTPNHGSYIDAIIAMGGVKRHVRFMGAQELWHDNGGVIGKLGSHFGAFPIDRSNGAQGLAVSRGILVKEDAIMMFPEGRLVRGEHLGEPRNGPAELALQMHAPVTPIGIYGNKAAYTRGRHWRLRPTADVVYGKAIDFGNLAPTQKNIEYARERIWRAVDDLEHQAHEAYDLRLAAAAKRRPYLLAAGGLGTAGAVYGVYELRN